MTHDAPFRPSVGTFCPRCGLQGRGGDRFCGACGESLALDVALPSSSASQPASGDEPDTVALPSRRLTPAADVAVEPFTLPAWAKKIPAGVWALTASAIVVFFVGVGIYQSNADAAESCTIGDYGRFSVIEDTPTCEAATDDRDLGQTLMGGGAVVAIALPVSALSRRRPGAGTPSGGRGQ